jgi:hypothetical protein
MSISVTTIAWSEISGIFVEVLASVRFVVNIRKIDIKPYYQKKTTLGNLIYGQKEIGNK